MSSSGNSKRINGLDSELILATRGNLDDYPNGLITIRVTCPSYIWTEILTHRLFARNASSSRAQSSSRHISMGYYIPETFYRDSGKGMVVGDEIPEETAWLAQTTYINAWKDAVRHVDTLTNMGVSREQANRLLPPIKLIKGIVTGTERAWKHFLSLRDSKNADVAMQLLAANIRDTIEGAVWKNDIVHIPFSDEDGNPLIAAANIARVSYSKTEKISADLELAERLKRDGHLSPFEHIAVYSKSDFIPDGVFSSNNEDWDLNNYRWQTYRSFIEGSRDWERLLKLERGKR